MSSIILNQDSSLVLNEDSSLEDLTYTVLKEDDVHASLICCFFLAFYGSEDQVSYFSRSHFLGLDEIGRPHRTSRPKIANGTIITFETRQSNLFPNQRNPRSKDKVNHQAVRRVRV